MSPETETSAGSPLASVALSNVNTPPGVVVGSAEESKNKAVKSNASEGDAQIVRSSIVATISSTTVILTT